MATSNMNCTYMEIGCFRGSSWERPYLAAMTAVVDRVRADHNGGLDSEAVFDIFVHSIDHVKAQFEIARGFMDYLCRYFNERLALDLSVDVAAYRRGAISGGLSGLPSDDDLIALVGRRFFGSPLARGSTILRSEIRGRASAY